MASYSAREATSDTDRSSTKRSSKCRLSKEKSDETARSVDRPLRSSPAFLGGGPLDRRRATRLHRPRRRLRVSRLVPHPDHVACAEHCLVPDLAVPYALGSGKPPAGIPQGAHPEIDLPGARRPRSRTDRTLHGRGQTPQPQPSEGGRLLSPSAHHISGALAVCVVNLR